MEVAAGAVGSPAAQGSPASPRATRIGIAFLRADRILGVDTQMQGKAPLEAPPHRLRDHLAGMPAAPGSVPAFWGSSNDSHAANHFPGRVLGIILLILTEAPLV